MGIAGYVTVCVQLYCIARVFGSDSPREAAQWLARSIRES
jgi:hypothetical protein